MLFEIGTEGPRGPDHISVGSTIPVMAAIERSMANRACKAWRCGFGYAGQ